MGEAKILLVDDEPLIVKTAQAYLEKEGFVVQVAGDGPTALRLAHTARPDLVVLDIMLPGMDGLEVLRRLRQESSVFVLMLTAKAEETDKIVGLNMGADDYMTKPFSPRELVARIKAVLRRGRAATASEDVITLRNLRIDASAHQVWKNDICIGLTSIEFDLLCALARNRGRVLSREQLIEQVWGYDYFGDDRVVDVHVARLRKKLEEDPDAPNLLVTVRGAGYRLEDEPE